MSRELGGTQPGPTPDPLKRNWVPTGSQVGPPVLAGLNSHTEIGRPPTHPVGVGAVPPQPEGDDASDRN